MFRCSETEEKAFVERMREKYLSGTDMLTEKELVKEFNKFLGDGLVALRRVKCDEEGNVTGGVFSFGPPSERPIAVRVFKKIFLTES